MTVSQPRPQVTGLKYKPKDLDTMSLVSQIFELREKLALVLKKPAAQAAGTDPSRCTSTNKQNLPLY